MPPVYDAVVIGTGVSGTTASFQLSEAGKKIAVVDEREFGGTCPLRGCDPKKILVGAAEIMDRFHRMEGRGLTGSTSINWKELIEFKRTFTRPYPGELEQSMRKAGMDLFHGQAEFTGESSLKINGKDISFRRCIIATGAKPRPLGIQGENLLTLSEEFLDAEAIPENIIFIGGGFISFEFAHIAARAGSKPLILHRSSRVLKPFDPDLTDKLLSASRNAGIEIKTNQTVSTVSRTPRGLKVLTEEGKEFTGDLVVHGAGRVPETEKLKPANAGIEAGKKGIKVNSRLQSVSNPAVYAVGDASNTGLPKTPVATVQAQIAAHNIIHTPKKEFDFLTTPSVVFTLPVLAKAGMLEEEARQKNLGVTVTSQDMSSWFNSRRIRLEHAGFKTLVEKESGKILGAHILGHHAEELINLFALAIQYNLTPDQLTRLPYSYPTAGYDIRSMF
jgi:glutathione reductase (NADPH)